MFVLTHLPLTPTITHHPATTRHTPLPPPRVTWRAAMARCLSALDGIHLAVTATLMAVEV